MTNHLVRLLAFTLAAATLAVGGSAVQAGELARLHGELAAPSTGAPAGTPAGAPAGTPAAPPPAGPGAPGALGNGAGQTGIMPLQPLPTRAPLPPIERLGYESLRCRGTCPAFTVIFAADGSFTYVGESNVERLGEHTGRVDTFALEQTMRYVEAIDFRGLADTYPTTYADVQTTYTLVDWGHETKVIENQGGNAPVTVWALERLLLDLLDDAAWD